MPADARVEMSTLPLLSVMKRASPPVELPKKDVRPPSVVWMMVEGSVSPAVLELRKLSRELLMKVC
jgi:hypothetical protein